MGGKMNIKEGRKRNGPVQAFARWLAKLGLRSAPMTVEIQWPMAQESKVFEIQKFDRPQVELLIWMMYGAGFDHDAITILLQNMGTAKMASLDAIQSAMDGTEPIKDKLNKAWSTSGGTPQ